MKKLILFLLLSLNAGNCLISALSSSTSLNYRVNSSYEIQMSKGAGGGCSFSSVLTPGMSSLEITGATAVMHIYLSGYWDDALK